MAKRPLYRRVSDPDTQYNFQETLRNLVELGPVAFAQPTGDVVLAIGDNLVTPTVTRPQGRILAYQSAASTLTDKGLNATGQWVLNSTAACTVRLLFF
jgi:hypothetical protein